MAVRGRDLCPPPPIPVGELGHEWRVRECADRNAHRVQVDVGHWRAMRDDKLRHRIRQIADTVRISGRPVKLEPMNSYDRRIVHNTLKEDPDVMSFSPNDDARIKRITLQRRRR